MWINCSKKFKRYKKLTQPLQKGLNSIEKQSVSIKQTQSLLKEMDKRILKIEKNVTTKTTKNTPSSSQTSTKTTKNTPSSSKTSTKTTKNTPSSSRKSTSKSSKKSTDNKKKRNK